MICRACKLEHPAMQSCAVARRLRAVTHSEIPGNAHESEVTHTLTNAEKQRAYRKRHADAVREANRLRMRSKRAK